MFPWMFWMWAPQVHYPLSGDVKQRIEPDWFFSGIKTEAGNAAVEKRAFEKASYGTQLEQITELLLDIAGQQAPNSGAAKKAKNYLENLKAEIAGIKKEESTGRIKSMEEALKFMKDKKADAFKEAQDILLPLLERKT